MTAIKHITDANFWDEIRNTSVALVDFWAPWCGPCRMMEPILAEANTQLGDKVAIMKMNVDENMVVPNGFSIRGIPTMIVFSEGKQVESVVGLRSLQDIVGILSKYTK